MGRSIFRTAQILDVIRRKFEGYTFKQLSEALNFPQSSLWGILSDLVRLEFLILDPETKKYSLGPRVLLLAASYLANQDIVQIGRPFVRRAVQLTGESSTLLVRYKNEVLFVNREDCDNISMISTARVGQRGPMYATSGGKAMLAYLSDEDLGDYLSSVELIPCAKHTITNPDILIKELESIRDGALARTRDEFNDGMSAIGAPIFDMFGEAIAAIDVPVPTFRLSAEKETGIEHALRMLSSEFSQRLGFDGVPNRLKPATKKPRIRDKARDTMTTHQENEG